VTSVGLFRNLEEDACRSQEIYNILCFDMLKLTREHFNFIHFNCFLQIIAGNYWQLILAFLVVLIQN